MRNQSKGDNKKAGPSSVDKASGKQGMSKPAAKKQEVRGSRPAGGGSKPAPPTRGTNKPAARSEGRKNEAGSRPVAAKPVAEKKPVRGATKPTRPTPPNAPAKAPQTTAPTPAPNRLGSATIGIGSSPTIGIGASPTVGIGTSPNIGIGTSPTMGIGASPTVGIGGRPKPVSTQKPAVPQRGYKPRTR
jgi:hypothetical protein